MRQRTSALPHAGFAGTRVLAATALALATLLGVLAQTNTAAAAPISPAPLVTAQGAASGELLRVGHFGHHKHGHGTKFKKHHGVKKFGFKHSRGFKHGHGYKYRHGYKHGHGFKRGHGVKVFRFGGFGFKKGFGYKHH